MQTVGLSLREIEGGKQRFSSKTKPNNITQMKHKLLKRQHLPLHNYLRCLRWSKREISSCSLSKFSSHNSLQLDFVLLKRMELQWFSSFANVVLHSQWQPYWEAQHRLGCVYILHGTTKIKDKKGSISYSKRLKTWLQDQKWTFMQLWHTETSWDFMSEKKPAGFVPQVFPTSRLKMTKSLLSKEIFLLLLLLLFTPFSLFFSFLLLSL